MTILTCFIVGAIIASKYIQYKQNTLLFIGLAICGIYIPWWPSGFAFIYALLTNGAKISDPTYFIIGNALIPLFAFLWVYGISLLLNLKRKWLLPVIYLVITIAMDIYLFYYLITDYTAIGNVSGYFDAQYNPLMSLYLIFINLSVVVTGLLFARRSLKAESEKIRLKGKFLVVAFLCYFFGAVFDAETTISPIILIISRFVLISGAICFYIGFLLPQFILRLFEFE
ncbi:MAG: hypothetical protein R6U96_02825 [Promethearchaeia archaeon]